jgi:transcriptional regulator with PAS, ATPase and Fis domain|tara:strand:- start:668 stop:841 length:174 start_codon:yes stop_codon:yes gene_type:complete
MTKYNLDNLERLLDKHNGNRRKVSAEIKVSEQSFYNWLKYNELEVKGKFQIVPKMED